MTFPFPTFCPSVAVSGGNDAFTKLLLHCDGADASTTFTDSSASARTVTVNGSAQIDTAQSKFGGASGLFVPSGDSLTLTDHADFAFGSGDWTVDFWIRFIATTGAQLIYDHRPTGTEGLYPTLLKDSGHKLVYSTDSGDRIQGTTTLVIDTWYHVAVTKSGSSTKMFLDGTQEGSTYSDSNTYINGTARPIIGRYGVAASNYLHGWIDELRVSKGIARWTTTFTPPSAAYF